jgi:gas vesicle protein
MGEDPRQIRREIEDTRSRMTETVEAIGYRTDLKTRTRDAFARRKDTVVSRASGAVNRVVGAMPDVPSPSDMSMPSMPGFVPDGEQVRNAAHRGVSTAQANPLGLGVASVAAGFLVGMLLPSSRAEDQRLGELSDELKDQARQAGQEALDRGRQVAQDAAHSASEAVQQSGREQGQQMAESLRQSAEDISS